MANIVNGTATGGGGLITTGDSSDELQLQTAETARVTLTNTAVVVNEDGNDVDFRVEGDTDANLLFVDASTDKVGIGTSSPAALFQVQGVVAGGSSGITANRLVAANANPGLSAYSSSTADTSVDLLYLRKEGGANNASNNVAIAFGVAAGDTYYVGQRIKAYRDGSNGNGGLIFETKSDSSDNTTTERIRILSSGGITFNGDTAAANALDDYEEGTWTPAFGADTGFSSITYDSIRGGQYTKIGNFVYCQGIMRTDAISGGSGSVYISGLPFTVGANISGLAGTGGMFTWGETNFAGDYPYGGEAGSGGTIVLLLYRTASNGSPSALQVSDLGTGTNANQFRFMIWYQT